MKTLFEYNWQVRDDWFSWCRTIPQHELLTPRVGGVGGILQTLFHVVVVEYSWVCDMTGYPDIEDRYEPQTSLDEVVSLSSGLHPIVEDFVSKWTDDQERQPVTVRLAGEIQTFQRGEVVRHMIAHEIHHIGQLSVWARELEKEPVTANLIRRGLYV